MLRVEEDARAVFGLGVQNMKYLVVGVVLAAIVALEVATELASGHDAEALVCMAPESQRESLRESLLLHLKSH